MFSNFTSISITVLLGRRLVFVLSRLSKSFPLFVLFILSVVNSYANFSVYTSGKHNFNKVDSPINSFNISIDGKNLILSWDVDKTVFNFYEVEKSLDGKNFSTIGLVLDAPEKSNTCLFKYKKENASAFRMIWYRVKGIKKNGTVFYSTTCIFQKNKQSKEFITCKSA